jgi:hypothetical protein
LEFLKTQVEVELDLQWDMEDVGEDLRLPVQDDGIRRTEEDQRNLELIRDRAEKNKKKLETRNLLKKRRMLRLLNIASKGASFTWKSHLVG